MSDKGPNIIIALKALEEIAKLPHCDRHLAGQIARDAIKKIGEQND